MKWLVIYLVVFLEHFLDLVQGILFVQKITDILCYILGFIRYLIFIWLLYFYLWLFFFSFLNLRSLTVNSINLTFNIVYISFLHYLIFIYHIVLQWLFQFDLRFLFFWRNYLTCLIAKSIHLGMLFFINVFIQFFILLRQVINITLSYTILYFLEIRLYLVTGNKLIFLIHFMLIRVLYYSLRFLFI